MSSDVPAGSPLSYPYLSEDEFRFLPKLPGSMGFLQITPTNNDEATLREWERVWLRPMISNFDQWTLPPISPEQSISAALKFSKELTNLYEVFKNEFTLSNEAKLEFGHLHDNALACLGGLWSAYYDATEACARGRIETSQYYRALCDPSVYRIKRWLSSEYVKLSVVHDIFFGDEFADMQLDVTRSCDDWPDHDQERAWSIFLAAAERCLATGARDLDRFRARDGWQARFRAFGLGSSKDYTLDTIHFVKDPVTLGGAMALFPDPDEFRNGTIKERSTWLATYTIMCISCPHMLKAGDLSAEQAVYTLLALLFVEDSAP
ncbi:hypothetical protein EV122DRAFT_276561 [Schizophyllum commune]